MKKLLFGVIASLALIPGLRMPTAAAQGYVKLNALYALAGVANPAVEFAISPKSTLQTDIVVSPWKSINDYHMLFAIFMGEYRRYFKGHNEGWYLGANLGMMAFNMSKPYIQDWKLKFENRYCKGYGMMIGLCVGWEHRLGERWLVDAYLGWAWMDSHYNGYSFEGEIDMYPHRHVQPKYPDPFNGSSEWYPNKIGVSFGYRIFARKNSSPQRQGPFPTSGPTSLHKKRGPDIRLPLSSEEQLPRRQKAKRLTPICR